MNPLYPEVSHRAAHRCEYCHAPEVIFNFHSKSTHPVRGEMFIEVDVWGVAPRQGCNVLLRLKLASLNELAQSGSTTLHPWRGAGPK